LSNDYEKFLEHTRREEDKLPTGSPSLSIGMKDGKGNLLLLGGRNSKLWKLSTGEYAVHNTCTFSEEEAMKAYNEANGTNWKLDYISKQFKPWYEKQFPIVAVVPSRSTPGETYNVTRDPNGKLICDLKCRGFRHYGHCWHTDAVKELKDEG